MNTFPLNRGSWIAILLFLLATSLAFSNNNIIYVDISANSNTGNGNSWASAYKDLQSALTDALTNPRADQIWVAAGTYKPSVSDRNISFDLVPNVAVYGGFSGTETSLGERDPAVNITILSGDIGTIGDTTDNSYHVVKYVQQSQEEILFDGFQITGGQADGNGNNDKGGGLFIHAASRSDTLWVRVENCRFYENHASRGGGLAYLVEDAVLLDTIEQCVLEINTANNGGGIWQFKGNNSQLMTFILNTAFYNNHASANGGGIAHGGNNGTFGEAIAPNLIVVNGVFSGNSATNGAGLISADFSSESYIFLRNSTFYQNTASSGDGHVVYVYDANFFYFQNSIAWSYSGNPFYHLLIAGNANQDPITITNSIVQGGYKNQGDIIDADPDFLDPDNNDFRLEACSPAIDTGISYTMTIGQQDIAGKDRVYNGTVDLGAHEFDATHISLPPVNRRDMTSTASGHYTDPAGWTHYCDCTERHLLLSMNTDGQDLGNPEVSVEMAEDYGTSAIDLSNADYLTGNEDWWVINRIWKVRNADPFSNPVRVRFFYDQTDVDDLKEASGGAMTDFWQMTFYKINGAGAYDPNVDVNDYQGYEHGAVASSSTWTDSTYNGQPYAEFKVTEFSEGSAGWRGFTALPVEWSSFYGESKGNHILLSWETETEIDNDYFILERSLDGFNFVPFYKTQSQGSGPNRYQAVDATPFNGKNYYRVRQVDYNGAVSYSKVIAIDLEFHREHIQLFPNPTTYDIHFQLPEALAGELEVTVLDKFGRQVLQQIFANGALASYRLDLQDLPSGHYVLRVDGHRYRSFSPFVIVSR